jgi:hypothetical protein
MTADSNSRGASWDPATGIQTGGDNLIFTRRAAPVVARALLAQGRQDSMGSIPSGLPVVGGPKIVHAYRESATSVVLTVQHDAGSDLRVPLRAANGMGFLVMDVGSVPSPGVLVPATACARVDATHLRLTLAQALVNASAACLLFYPYGSFSPTGAPGYRADMGRGNAVTDNFSAVTKPAGWDIGGDLGSVWNLDFPWPRPRRPWHSATALVEHDTSPATTRRASMPEAPGQAFSAGEAAWVRQKIDSLTDAAADNRRGSPRTRPRVPSDTDRSSRPKHRRTRCSAGSSASSACCS